MSESITDTVIPTGGKLVTYNCSYCHRDITSQCRIHCSHKECNNKFELCCDCFASGVELYPHDITHYSSYQVVDCLDFPLFSKDWTANEELLLLEGIDKHGVGNWKLISEYMGTGKYTHQIEHHYWNLYMGKFGHLLPTKVYDNENSFVDTTNYVDTTFATVFPEGCNLGDEVIRDKNYSKSKSTENKEKPINPMGYDLPGFMPLREDFDIEYENDAEVLLADMEFPVDKDGNSTEHPSERELKLQVINIYNLKLNERNKRKRFVIDYKQIDITKQQQFEKKLSKEEKELVGRLKIFARFQTPQENECLIEGILRLKKIQQQIEIFKLYRAMGLSTVQDIREYEANKKKRDIEIKLRKAKESNSYLYETGKAKKELFYPSVPYNNKRKSIELNNDDSQTSSTELVETIDTNTSTKLTQLDKAYNSDLLNTLEIQFCQELNILPNHYLAIKEAIVREAYRNGMLTLDGVRRIVKMDDDQTSEIYDFFIKKVNLNDIEAKIYPKLFILPRYKENVTVTNNSTNVSSNSQIDEESQEIMTSKEINISTSTSSRKRGRGKFSKTE